MFVVGGVGSLRWSLGVRGGAPTCGSGTAVAAMKNPDTPTVLPGTAAGFMDVLTENLDAVTEIPVATSKVYFTL